MTAPFVPSPERALLECLNAEQREGVATYTVVGPRGTAQAKMAVSLKAAAAAGELVYASMPRRKFLEVFRGAVSGVLIVRVTYQAGVVTSRVYASRQASAFEFARNPTGWHRATIASQDTRFRPPRKMNTCKSRHSARAQSPPSGRHAARYWPPLGRAALLLAAGAAACSPAHALSGARRHT